jgi:hypothetical protein
VPLWWKSTADRVIVTGIIGVTVASFIASTVKLYKFSAGQL